MIEEQEQSCEGTSFTVFICLALLFIGISLGAVACSLFYGNVHKPDGCEHRAMLIAMTRQCGKEVQKQIGMHDKVINLSLKVDALRVDLEKSTQVIALEKAKTAAAEKRYELAMTQLDLAEILLKNPE